MLRKFKVTLGQASNRLNLNGLNRLIQRIAQPHNCLVIVDHCLIRDIQSRPLRPVEGVIHERTTLVPIQHRQMVDVVSNGNTFNIQETVSTTMHPATIMWLHF